MQKYKQMFEREKREMEDRFMRECQERLNRMEKQLEEERSEVARLKSLE